MTATDNKRAASAEQEDENMKQYGGVKIRQRNDGRWYARIPLMPGKYHYVYAKTQQECYSKLREIMDKPKRIKELRKAIATPEVKAEKRYTLEDWYLYWLKTYKIPKCKESSIRKVDNIYCKHIAKIGKMYIDELTAAAIQEFLASIKSDCMRKKTYTHLADMLRKAYVTEVIAKNPLNAVEVPKYKAKERTAMEPEEQQRFIAEARKSEYWAIYALMLFEGLRTGEAKALRPCDIKQDCIIVGSSVNDKGEVTDTKTGNVRRVPIFAPFREVAEKLRGSSTELLFKPNKHTANDEYREIMQRLGLNYNMYALRHTFATNCARAGINSKQVQLWLGHSDVSMTLKYYTNISDSFEAANVAIFDTIFDTNFS